MEREELLGVISRHIRLIEPLGYLDMVMLEKNNLQIAGLIDQWLRENVK